MRDAPDENMISSSCLTERDAPDENMISSSCLTERDLSNFFVKHLEFFIIFKYSSRYVRT